MVKRNSFLAYNLIFMYDRICYKKPNINNFLSILIECKADVDMFFDVGGRLSDSWYFNKLSVLDMVEKMHTVQFKQNFCIHNYHSSLTASNIFVEFV